MTIPKITIFDTGEKVWRNFDNWPPQNSVEDKLFLTKDSIRFSGIYLSKSDRNHTEYWSNPNNPVPYTLKKRSQYYRYYFTENQNFALERDDLISFISSPLKRDITVSGQIIADLFVTTTGTDCDWVVKIIDVIIEDSTKSNELMVRGDIMRSKFHDNPSDPEPLLPEQITEIKWSLPDVLHTFKKGHQIKVQIQSSWFPLYDMNPQKFCNISEAEKSDFIKTKQKVFHSKEYPSKIIIPCVNNE